MRKLIFASLVVFTGILFAGCSGGGDGGAPAGGAVKGSTTGRSFGSCSFAQQNFCMDYTGKGFEGKAQQLSEACQQQGGAPSNAGCATAKLSGSCLINKGQEAEMVAHGYTPLTKGEIQAECQNLGGQIL